MTPTETTVTETRYICGNCKRTHGTVEQAAECCVCEKCHKRAATHDNDGPARMARSATWCASCFRARKVRALKDKIESGETWLQECENRARMAREGLETHRAELEALRGARTT